MRNGQNKRMRGRNRNHKGHHGGGGGGSGGGGHHHNPLTRVYESNGPDVKIRGTAHHVAEKYLQLARDAQGSGDPVTAENHFQHAEHYLRMIAAAQEQFRAQNPYYQAPPAPGEIRDDAFEGDDDGSQPGQGQPMQGQPHQGQPQQGQPQQGQPNFGNPQNYNNQPQPPYPPREQPQPYGGQQPNSNYQGRPQHQPQQHQPYNPPPQQYQQPSQPPSGVEAGDAGQLPSFITGTQPQQSAPNPAPNGYDNQGGDRFPRHRRRRHRGPGGPRPDLPNMPQDFQGDEGPEAGNS
jgi:hypothetical protein